MLQAARTPKLNIYTYSEMDYISGFVGNFNVEIIKKARYVKKDCNGCGACMEICPAYRYNEFNLNMNSRKAIYIAFAQAVPMIAQVDMNTCIQCNLCLEACELNAIDFAQTEELIDLKVGSIVVATGWDEYEPEIGYLGYKEYPNIITQMQLERIIAPNGPSLGHIVRPSDGQTPKTILFVQCVGSRDFNKNNYCSSGVCCMVSIKNAKLIKQHDPDSEITIAYIDIRASGKDYEEYYTASRKEGIKYIRTNISKIQENPENHNLKVIMQNTLRESIGLKEYEFDLIVLSAAMVPAKGVEKIQKLLKLETSQDKFFKEFHSRLNPIDTKIPGIVLAGACQGPKSIAESISQGKAAASSVNKLMSKDKFRILLIRADIDKEKCAKCGLCALNCPYGAINLMDSEADSEVKVNEILCRGCGSCLANCPSEAITLKYYREKQYEKQIDAILEDY